MSAESGSAFENLFVGRREYLEEFERLSNGKAGYRVLFIPGEGGIGKTWLLRKMLSVAQGLSNHNNLLLPESIMDMYSTAHHSVEGVQEHIVDLLQKAYESRGTCFVNFDNIKREIDIGRRENFETETITDMEKRAGRAFIEDCKSLSETTTPILFIDTFERVQRDEVGRWILFKLVPELPGFRFVIAGRDMLEEKSYIHPYPLRGFTDEEAMEYFLRKREVSDASDFADVLGAITEKAEGRPLFIDLAVSWFKDEQLRNAEVLRRTSVSDFKKSLIRLLQQQQGVFGNVERDVVGQDVILFMAYYRYRFDAELLKRLVDKKVITLPKDMSPETVLKMIEEVYLFVKRLPDKYLQHHDEVETLILDYWWPEHDPRGQNRQSVLAPIAVEWYEDLFQDPKHQSNLLDLQAEQIMYLLDAVPEQAVRRIEEHSQSQRFNELLVSEISTDRIREIPTTIHNRYKFATDLGKRATFISSFERAQAYWKLAFEIAESDNSSDI